MGTAISFEGLFNVRDLGGMPTSDGHTIRSGLLFRGGQLFPASESDLKKLHAAGVRKVIDFRSIGEHEEKPDPPMPGVENVFLPIIEDVGVGITRGTKGDMRIIELFKTGHPVEPEFIDDHMRKMYRSFVEDPFANAQYARFIDEVIETAESNGATYWHCTAGKDRAGFAAAILLLALGVPRANVIADYLQTNEYLRGVVGQLMSLFDQNLPTEGSRDALRRLFVASRSYIDASLDAIDNGYGSFDVFLTERLNIDRAKRQKLRDLLLI